MAPITKRQRENSAGDFKAVASAEATSAKVMQWLTKKLDEHLANISNKIGKSEERILTIFHEQMEGMNRDLQSLHKRDEQLEKKTDDVQALRAQVSTLEKLS